MKYKTTQKAVKGGYSYVIQIPYCAAQHLLSHHNPVAYTVRREGWAADIYDFDQVAIVTGYAPFGNVKPEYTTIAAYEEQANKITNNPLIIKQQQKIAVNYLLELFIKKTIGK